MLRIAALAVLLFTALPASAAAPAVPLVSGLVVTTAIAEPGGDYESRKRLVMREDDGWRLEYSSSRPGAGGVSESIGSLRLLHDADLQSARRYRHSFEADVEEDYPGTTALGTSAAVLEELKISGKSRFAVVGEDPWMRRALAGGKLADGALLQLAGELTAGRDVSFKGELQRRATATLSVLVNGRPQRLPAVVASGRFTAGDGRSMDAELSFLDDPANPIALEWRIGPSRLRVVRLDFPEPQLSLAATLQQQKRVALPGLYFDFGSAVLRPESAAAIAAIRTAIAASPSALRLEGHTDGTGSAEANQRLSLARAEAVRSALIRLDPAVASRLSARGLGATKPVAGNDTLEGRAQNRRVELLLP